MGRIKSAVPQGGSGMLPFPEYLTHEYLSLFRALMKLMASVTQEALYQGLQPPDSRMPLSQSLKTCSRMSSVRAKANKDSHSTSGINGHWEVLCLD